MDIEFVVAGASLPPKAALALVVFEGEPLAGAAAEIDRASGGALARALEAGRFTGAKGQVLDLPGLSGVEAARVLLVGAGKADKFDDLGAEHAAASAFAAVKTSGLTLLRVQGPSDRAPRLALGVRLAAYRFDRYKTKEPAEKKPSVVMTQVVADNVDAALAAFAPLSAVADAVVFTRDLVSEPANILYPAEFARRVKALEGLGLQIEILGEEEMAKLGMGALLGVGQGCFDTGGISIKPADGMEDMKWDMGGAAAVAGLMHALAGRKAKVNAVGILGLVENMPDGNAQRPGDIVSSMSGQTIEVINTDAEGRLVLADALWYCQDRFKPKFMVDVATLTGAIIIALGNDYAGLFSNDDELAANLLAAAEGEGEGLWRMPMPSQYEKGIESLAADMKNVGARPGGSITAALFLQKFTNGKPWAHLDIASTAWKKPSSVPTSPEGATGFGVRLLNRMVADKYEG
jgi:leucyl aminopeptidase